MAEMLRPDYIVLAGRVGSGKSTLVEGVREEYAGSLVVPKLYSTEPVRDWDNPDEVEHVDEATFDIMKSQGKVDPYWHRRSDIGKVDLNYGFEPDGRIPKLLVVNNEFLRASNPSIEKIVLRGALIIARATAADREHRLRERVSTSAQWAREWRLTDRHDGEINVDMPIESIDTSALSLDESRIRLRALLDDLLSLPTAE